MDSQTVTATDQELAELHAALLRARAMGFEETAAAMQRVLDEMLKASGRLQNLVTADSTSIGEHAMKDPDVRVEVSHSLCRICASARRGGNRSTTGLAQTALKTARSEMGTLPIRGECPMGANVEPGCPLVQRAKG